MAQSTATQQPRKLLSRERIGLVLGPALFLIFYFVPALTGLEDAPRAVLSVTLWVATWWITEAMPIPATSLMPLFLLPMTGGTDQATAAMAYANPIVFMYMGGFTIALAIQKWDLHKRIAMTVIRMVGTRGHRIMLGIILATAGLSMWISNAATALMMLPIGLALIEEVKEKQLFKDGDLQKFAKGLLLSIAYAASIGGLATLIGSVPNAVFAAQAEIHLGIRVSFAQWFIFAFPLTVLMLLFLYVFLSRVQFRIKEQPEISSDFAKDQLQKLGPMSYEEKTVLGIFVVVGALWMTIGFIPEDWNIPLTDPTVSILGAVAMFLLPARQLQDTGDGEPRRGGILIWKDMTELPWGILLLFGGGLSLAAAFEESGLTPWFGEQLGGLEVLPYVAIVVAIAAIVLFMTEIMSNTAVSNMLIPVSVGLALGMGIDPFAIMAIVALTSSMAFMLPISTPPNAAVFTSEYLTISDMVKAGFWMNVASLTLVSLFILLWQPVVLSSGM
ncbi:SLC13 family permease [Kocuria sp.]|uniref:SLC13 family permease n=1 Tax=Kocuria sp. TaxID=1871328 RepID=UPI0026DF7C49|nr:DASS family sodium-coupled anion symporter [Kocuria sp.]MDO5618258.1 DASS family sodium-coupled anion symporter [Kocuria sp.]